MLILPPVEVLTDHVSVTGGPKQMTLVRGACTSSQADRARHVSWRHSWLGGLLMDFRILRTSSVSRRRRRRSRLIWIWHDLRFQAHRPDTSQGLN
jgi:hypothetical protein